jgi:hypothetical protein
MAIDFESFCRRLRVQFLINELAPENRRRFLRRRQVAADQVFVDLGTLFVKESPGNEQDNHAATALPLCTNLQCTAAQMPPKIKQSRLGEVTDSLGVGALLLTWGQKGVLA